MPPRLLSVELTPATGLVGRGFAREGISASIRGEIYDSLAPLETIDLVALAAGFEPEQFGLVKPDQIAADLWKRLTASYADAMVIDRRRRSELVRQVLLVLLSVGLTAAMSLPIGMWLERRKRESPRD